MLIFLLLLITYFSSFAISQDQSNSPSGPTIAQCGPRLLPLAACAPFVQGVSRPPTQSCCDNLRLVNDLQPRCLCLLLNNTSLTSTFPINTTLAMQLPLICSVRVDFLSCSGASLPSIPPTPQVSLGSTNNSTVAASPMVKLPPKSGFMGLGFHQNYAVRSKLKGPLQLLVVVVLVLVSSTCTRTLY